MKKTLTSKLLALLVCVAMLFTVIQIPITASAAELTNLLPNGTFDTNVAGWKNSNSGWGSLDRDADLAAVKFTKTSASSGPTIYSQAVKAESGSVVLKYDYKTSVALTGTATSVYIYAYTADTVASKGSNHFTPSGSNYKYEFVNTTTSWQTKEITYTLPEGYEYVQVVFGFRGGVAANTILNIDNVFLYEVNENYAVNAIEKAIAANDQASFNTWIADAVLGIENLDGEKYADYFEALKKETTITKAVIQSVVDSFVSNAPKSLLPNGTFESDVLGWKCSNSSWGTLAWDETAEAMSFTKVSASSGPAVYSQVVKATKGARVHLSYDYKTSVALSGVATSVYFYAYTAEYVEKQSTTLFGPTGSNYKGEFVDTKTDWQTKELIYTLPEDCEYVQVQIAFRGAVAAKTVLTVDNVSLYEVNEDYLLHKISTAVSGNDKSTFEKWITDEALALQNLDETKYADYFEALKKETEITKSTLQAVVDSFASTDPVSILSNGTFSTGVDGWKCSNNAWGTVAWDQAAQAMSFTKVSASSGPTVYTEVVKVEPGSKVYLKYDYKTSAALTGTATSVSIYGYTSDFVNSKGTTYFNPTGDEYTYEFVDTKTNWQTKEISYTVPEGYEYVQVVIGFRGAVAANTVLSLDNVYLYEVNEDYVVYQIKKAVEDDDLSLFNLWVREKVLGINSLDPDKTVEYFTALKQKEEITKEVIQAVVDSFVVEGAPISMLPNGSFSADVSGWKVSNTSWGTLTWDSGEKAASFTKVSASSGPSFYSDLVKVQGGSRVCLNYDFKTSKELTGNATVVYVYAYTAEFVDSKGTTYFNPTGSAYTYEFVNSTTEWQSNEITYAVPQDCSFVQVVFGFRGAAAANTVMLVDNVKLYNIDADYVLYKIAEAVKANNRFDLEDWMKEEALGLENVNVANRRAYLTELAKETEILTKEKVQAIVNTVNTACAQNPLIANGTFDTNVYGWRAFNATSPSASYSAVDGGTALLTKERGLTSVMLSEVVDVAYGDIIHLEFTAKANTGTKLTVKTSQFTSDELAVFGDDAAQQGKEADSSESESFTLTTEAQKFVVDIRIDKGVYGLVAAFSQVEANVGDMVYIDNVTLKRGTAEFVNNKLNSAIIDGDGEAFARWMKHKNSGLLYEIITVTPEFMASLKAAREEKGANLTAKEMQIVSANMVTDIGTRLELFVDDTLIDTQNTTAELEVMKPEFAGQVLNASGGFVCDNIANQVYTGHFDPSRITEDTRPWESLGSSGACVLKVGDKLYCYYRGVDEEVQTVDRYVNGYGNHDPSVAYYLNVTVAESTDGGKTWTRPELGLYGFEYNGTVYDTNIIIGDIMENFDGRHLCSFAAFEDKSPNANPEKPYKAMMVTVMSRGWGFDLFALESADGIHWDLMNNGEPVISNGRSDIMDSENVAFWSETDQEYKMYFRMWHNNPEYGEQRGISVISSKDFINWTDIDTESIPLDYYSDKTNEELTARNEGLNGNHPDGYQFYTNSMYTYDRAPHIYIGMPTRYLGNKAIETAPYLAAGRDGVNFKLWDTMLIEPSAELDRNGNRSNYADYPIFRTSETEYSFFAHRGFKDSGMIYDRFTFRVDGFVAAKGDATGKYIVTTPITFNGESLILNYKAPEGTVRAQLTDVDGNVLKGFSYNDCTALTGDSIEQEITWTGDLSTINQPVKISFELTNAELYSYRFACVNHNYDHACDTDCNECGEIRTTEHVYTNACDAVCDVEGCGFIRTPADHEYDGDTDADCNECGDIRVLGAQLIKEDGVWYYYYNGIKSNETTLVKWSGKWFYIIEGVWDSSVTSLVKYSGKWFYVQNGKWDSSITNTLVKYNGKWFYIKNGKWDSSVNDLIKYEGKWFYIKSGKWDSSAETLFKKNDKWFAIKSGKWYKGESIITYSDKQFYVNNGFAQLTFSGEVTIGSKTYTVKNGKVV